MIVKDRFEVKEEIHAGRHCRVHLAVDRLKGNLPLALKVVGYPGLRGDVSPFFLDRMRRVSNLFHDRLPRVHDFGLLPAAAAGAPGAPPAAPGPEETTAEGSVGYLLTDLVPGRPFTEACKIAQPGQIAAWVVDLCDALEIAHLRGFCHHAICPENVRISTGGKVHLTDLGLFEVKLFAGEDPVSRRPAYASPELIRGVFDDPRADLYLLGVLLYETYAGRPPFAGTGARILRAHLRHAPRPIAQVREEMRADDAPALDPALEKVILRLLEKNPRNRYQRAQDCAREVAKLAGLKVGPQPGGPIFFPSVHVGRDEAMKKAREAIEASNIRRGFGFQATLVQGGCGVGKTRFLHEVAGLLAGSTWIAARLEGALSRNVILGLFRNLPAELAGHVPPEELRSFAANLAPLFSDPGEKSSLLPVPDRPDAEKRRIFSSLAWTLLRASREAPLMLLVDDLQLLDAYSVEFLQFFREVVARDDVASFAGGRIRGVHFLASLDPDRQASRRLTRLLDSLDPATTTVIGLDPLGADDISRLSGTFLGMRKSPQIFGRKLHEATSGLPLAAKEVVRDLVEEGLLFHDDGSWHLSAEDPAAVEVPKPDRVAERRLARISAAQMDLMATLAMLEVPGNLTLLAQVLEVEPDDVLELSHELVRRGMVTLGAHGGKIEFRLGHLAWEGQIMGRFGGDRAADLKRRIEKAFLFKRVRQTFGASRSRSVGLFERIKFSRNPTHLARAVALAYRCGDLERALAVCAEVAARVDDDPARHIPLLLLEGKARRALGDREKARQCFEKGLSLSKSEDVHRPDSHLVSLFMELAQTLAEEGEFERGVGILQDAIKLLGEHESPLARGTLLFTKGLLFVREGQFEKGLTLFEEGLAHLDKAPPGRERDLRLRLAVLDPTFLVGHPRPDPFLREVLEGLDAAGSREEWPGVEIPFLEALGEVATRRARYTRATDEFQRALTVAEEVGDLPAMARLKLKLSEVSFLCAQRELAAEFLSGVPPILAPRRAELDPERACGLYPVFGSLHCIPMEEGAASLVESLIEVCRLHAAQKLDQARTLLVSLEPIVRIENAWYPRAVYRLVQARLFGPEDRGRRAEAMIAALDDVLAQVRTFSARELTWQLEHAASVLLRGEDRFEDSLGRCKKAMAVVVKVLGYLPEALQASYAAHPERAVVKRDLGQLKREVGSVARRRHIESSQITLGTDESGARDLSGVSPAGEGSRMEQLVLEYRDEIKNMNLNLVREEIHNLEKLLDVNMQLNTVHDLENLLVLIIDTAIELTSAERGFLIFTSDGPHQFAVARDFERSPIGEPRALISNSIVHQVIGSQQAVISTNAQADERFNKAESVSDLNLRSLLCVPLRLRDDVLGVVYLDNRFEQGVFTEKDKKLLAHFADQAALAIHNARLLEENRGKQKDLEEQAERIKRLNAQLEVRGKQLQSTVDNQSVELAEVKAILRQQQSDLQQRYSQHRIIGKSQVMQEVFRLIDKVIESAVPVFIHGESGTGKELVARAIHFDGVRRDQPFAVENCAAITDTLLESELFGYVKGAFTGADKDRKGLFEVANHGTLFFDEVGDMSTEMQKKMLRVLQEGEIRRVGGKDLVPVDVRIISASNKNLKDLVEQGRFRDDLYYRLCVLNIRLPPLRERKEDIPLLAESFIEDFNRNSGTARTFHKNVMGVLTDYHWPGNIRELQNVITGVASLTDKDVLDADDFRREIPKGGPAASGPIFSEELSIDDYTKKFVLTFQDRYNDTEIARILGISRKTLWEKRKKWSLLRDKKS